MKKKILIALAVLALAFLGYRKFFSQKKAPKTIVETEVVKRGRITNAITATGKVEPVSQVQVGTQVSGTIEKIYVDYNSVVKKGQLLAELDKSTLRSSLAAAQTDYASQKNEYDYQQKRYERNKGLHDKQLISDTEFEEFEYQYVRAKNSMIRSKYEVEKASTNLRYATITSPINGVVISVEVKEGQTVAASMTTPTLFNLAENLTDMQVVANIDEADIGEIKEGQKVEFSVDAFPNDKFSGEVKQVRLEPTTNSNVVTYEVIVSAPNPDLKLKPGLTANISVFTMDKDSVITIPNKAIRFKMDPAMLPPRMRSKIKALPDSVKGVKVWAVTKDSVPVERVIKVGLTNGSVTEVISGLEEGEWLIVSSIETDGKFTPETKKQAGESNPFMPQRPGKRPR